MQSLKFAKSNFCHATEEYFCYKVGYGYVSTIWLKKTPGSVSPPPDSHKKERIKL